MQAAARGIRLRVVDTRAWVRTDPQLLRRILQNFLANALRYTRAGSILLGVRRDGDVLRIEVHDSGPGIAADQQRAIFEEFHRGTQVSPWGEKGLGLGLSICERIARLLGHRLDLRSRPGHGSVFSIDVARAVPATVAREAPQARAVGLVADLHGARSASARCCAT